RAAAILSAGASLGRTIVADTDCRRGERKRLTVVAGGKSRHARALLPGIEQHDGVVSASELERTGSLEILALEINARGGPRIGGARCEHRRLMRNSREPRGGPLDVLVSYLV